MKKIVLAYSGGLDTSVILAWLKQTYGVPVVAYIADVGQNDDVEAARAKAIRTGAADVVVKDLKDEFAAEYVFPAIAANAVYEGSYLLGTSLARPVIGKGQVEAARATGADTVSHGSTGKGNDQVRFELAVKALAPTLDIVAPWREPAFADAFVGRRDLLAYAEQHGIPVPVTAAKPYSMDANLMHISYEGGILEDPWAEPPADMFQWTVAPEDAPNRPEYVDVGFEQGVPVSIDGEFYGPARLLTIANSLGARHGVGRVDIVENRFVGIKSRGVYETPGATLLMHAHRAVESLTLDREVAHFKESLGPKFAELVYNGFWFSPEMDLLRTTIDASQKPVTGVARLKLFKGSVTVVGRRSPHSLYNPELSSFETRMAIKPSDSGGFINTNGLRLVTWAAKWPRS